MPDESFWKIPNVYDSVGVVGLFIGVGSVWFSWWLAKRDLQQRIADAQKQTTGLIHRLVVAVIQNDASEALRCMRDARQAIRQSDWAIAVTRIDDAEHYLARLSRTHLSLLPEDTELVARVIEGLTTLVIAVRKAASPSSKTVRVSDARLIELDTWIKGIAIIEARLRGHILEGGSDGR